MPSFELSKLQATSPARALSQSDRARPETLANRGDAYTAGAASAGVSLEINTGMDPSQPPVDQSRVEKIREALRDGSYPLVPTQIVDAIIAARVSFEIEPID